MLNSCENLGGGPNFTLQGQKNNRGITGKRVIKMNKTSNLQVSSYDFDPKPSKKNQQNIIRKSNETKNLTQAKKQPKKKHPSMQRNTQTPDLFIERRIKTEGPFNDQDAILSIKKDIKKNHVRSTIQPGSKTHQSIKKDKQKPSKSSKQSKDKHIKSCEIYGAWRRIPDSPDHIASQSITKKKRTNSTLISNDKVVSKLLNVSLLASELGGSQPITSDRKSAISNHSRTFKEYMSSIDMRIIRNIQDDVPVFLQKKPTGQDIVRNILRIKQISLEELTRKIILIQRSWKKRQRTSVINTYKRMFQKATDQFFKIDKNIEQVSNISIQLSHENSQDLDIFQNQNLASNLKKQQHRQSDNEEQSFQEEEQQFFDDSISDIVDNNSLQSERGPNFRKYRELVNEEIKSMNKKVVVPSQQKGGLDSKLLFEELMKQSFNKKWMQEDPPSLSDRKILNQDNIGPSSIQTDSYNDSLNHLTNQTFPKLSRNEDDEALDDSQIYDRNKYAMNSMTESYKEHQSENQFKLSKQEPQKYNQSQQIKKIQIDLQNYRPKIDQIQKKPKGQPSNEQVVVKNYLDCGLDNFSLQLNEKILQRISEDRIGGQEKDHGSSDQAIGQRFQRANLAILRRNEVKKSKVNSKLQKLSSNQIQQILNLIVSGLLDEFAVDISSILKKGNASIPQNPKPVSKPKPPGIQTDNEAIKTYIYNLSNFVKGRGQIMIKITENINKDIGPTSKQILSYLRPEPEDGEIRVNSNESEEAEEQDGLFVIPPQLFEEFQAHIEGQYFKNQKKEMGPRLKAYLSFWNRCVFQSFNECLDYQRPFGIEGKPYTWLREGKIQRQIYQHQLNVHFQKAQKRMLEQTDVVTGILFDKVDSPFYGADCSQEQMHYMNQQRLSRILANELLQGENTWINYNDQMAELLVQLSRMIEDRLFFQFSGGELKKLMRHRRILAEQSEAEQAMEFSLDQL